jgi:pimeloyl-ACP methyl ester carboxylesterase
MQRFLVLILLFFLYQTIFALKPDREYRYRPENFGLIYKEQKIRTSDNYLINTWFFPVQDSVPWGIYFQNPIKRDYIADNQKHPTIIICPADAGNMAPLTQFAFYMCPKGYNVLLFDWRGFGESDNFQINENYLCYTEFYKDYNAVIDSLKTFKEVDSNKIGIYGFSTGAYLSFPIIYQRNDISCFIARALTTDLESIKEYWLKKNGRQLFIPEDYPQKLYPKNIADKFTKPCFLIVGENDEITPSWMSQEIFSKLKCEKEMWIVKNADHRPEYSESVGLRFYINRMLAFYNKYLK